MSATDIMALAALLFVPAAGLFMIAYVRKLVAIAEYANENDLEVFGSKYRDVYQLYFDLSFLDALWSSGCYKNIDDDTLANLVASAHRMLRIGFIAGIAIIMLPIGWRVVEITAGT